MEQIKQDGLNEVLVNKFQSRIGRGDVNAKGAINRLIEEGKVSRDFIAYLGTSLQ